MASKTYLVTNTDAAICALGRTMLEIPANCMNVEMTLQDTPEMKRTIERIMRIHPQCTFVEKVQKTATVKTVTTEKTTTTTAKTASSKETTAPESK